MFKSSSGIKKATVIPVSNPVDPLAFEEAAEKLKFRDCKNTEEESWGFIKPDYSENWPLIPSFWYSTVIMLDGSL